MNFKTFVIAQTQICCTQTLPHHEQNSNYIQRIKTTWITACGIPNVLKFQMNSRFLKYLNKLTWQVSLSS